MVTDSIVPVIELPSLPPPDFVAAKVTEAPGKRGVVLLLAVTDTVLLVVNAPDKVAVVAVIATWLFCVSLVPEDRFVPVVKSVTGYAVAAVNVKPLFAVTPVA